MKIYHTETQGVYDSLMIELEEQGCELPFGGKPSEINNWVEREHLTCVRVHGLKVNHASLNYYKEEYPDTPIIKYKEKADNKMKFTKENVQKVIDEYFQEAGFESCGDLIAEIHNLDDKPEKVVVPKFVAEWIEYSRNEGSELSNMLACYSNFRDKVQKIETDGERAVKWYVDNPYKFIQAFEKGYTIGPEQLYYIPLPHLQLSDGTLQLLSTRKGQKNYSAQFPSSWLQQSFTKAELEQVPEIYKPFAKPIEE